MPAHSYPDQAQQTNKPDKKQQIEQLKKVTNHEDKDSELQKLRRSISSGCETMLKLVKSKLTTSLAKEHQRGKETWQRLAADYLYYNLDEVMRCIKLLFAEEHFIYE
ncbi:hypothetical protein M513_05180 [Trichuris suis]|uniref:Uncharacterized protein n=1 Tax=Trichuris suis TaxID=68888 RepID=A0A085M9L7_9BILA|nr:hypothetical protein M513_05180 [Trichuris suis]